MAKMSVAKKAGKKAPGNNNKKNFKKNNFNKKPNRAEEEEQIMEEIPEAVSNAQDASEDEESDSGERRDMAKMIVKQNKKNKKSGGFQSMGLSQEVFRGVMKQGYKVPTPIQRKVSPKIEDQRSTHSINQRFPYF